MKALQRLNFSNLGVSAVVLGLVVLSGCKTPQRINDFCLSAQNGSLTQEEREVAEDYCEDKGYANLKDCYKDVCGTSRSPGLLEDDVDTIYDLVDWFRDQPDHRQQEIIEALDI